MVNNHSRRNRSAALHRPALLVFMGRLSNTETAGSLNTRQGLQQQEDEMLSSLTDVDQAMSPPCSIEPAAAGLTGAGEANG